MRTAEDIALNYQLEDASTSLKTILLAMKEYAKEAIKVDRENIAKHANVEYSYGFGSTQCIVNKDSIINAPQIELK